MLRIWMTVIGLAAVVASAAAGQRQGDEQVRARQRISMMEGTLERAVSIGADNLVRRMKAVVPDAPMLSGAPVVRGFRLEGYGVFFDVGVPALRLPVSWPLRYMISDNRDFELFAADVDVLAADIRAVMAQLDARSQEEFAPVLRRIEMLRRQGAIAPGSSARASRGPVALSGSTDRGTADSELLDDPHERYTAEIREALVDAMIESSGPLALDGDEWLTVAARDNLPRDPLFPGDTADFGTLIFRVKGGDLAAFRGGRVTLDQVRERIEIREY